MKTIYDENEFYRAHLSRDARFDGKFFVAVKTTNIYCRPICPARKAKLSNLMFFIHAAQAEEAGFRPCLRCRPETAPGSSAWIGTSSIIRRAIRMMDSFALEDLSINDLASKLGIGARWLRDLFQTQVGASPQSILLAKKLDTARKLLDESSLPITEIAFSSGFQSIRRFNDAFKNRFHKSPSAFRKNPITKGQLRLQLSYRPPLAWDHLLDFFKQRALIGLEIVEENSYQRLITYGDTCGWFKATPIKNNKIDIKFKLNKNTNILEFVTRIKNIFDLDCDPMAIEKNLREDKTLHPFLEKHTGLRIPGCWDGFELAVRAVVGQLISVKAATTILGRLVALCGKKQMLDKASPLKQFFPTPQDILANDLANIGLPPSKINTLKLLAENIINKNLILDGTADFDTTCEKLLAIKGIGQWTVEYIAMRAFRNPDAFPQTDLEIKKKISRLNLHPQKWIPWRAYGAILLWNIKLDEKT